MLLDLNMSDLTGVLNYVAESDCACSEPWPFDEEADCVTCAARRLIGELCEQAPEDPYAVALRELRPTWPAAAVATSETIGTADAAEGR